MLTSVNVNSFGLVIASSLEEHEILKMNGFSLEIMNFEWNLRLKTWQPAKLL